MSKATGDVSGRKRKELTVFLILAVLLAPVIAVGLVGGYGFSIWMYQTISGPPGSSDTNTQSQ